MFCKRHRLIFILVFMMVNCSDQTTSQQQSNDLKAAHPDTKEGQLIIPPMENTNEWQPVGWGDPLKQDPTFDYLPPVLDRVRYWGETSPNQKNDILLLGVSSKKISQNTQKEKHNYSAIKRTYSPHQNQQQFPSRYKNQQQQYVMFSPPKFSESYSHSMPMKNYHQYQHHHYHNWKMPSIDSAPEQSGHQVRISKPFTSTTRSPVPKTFLPTISPEVPETSPFPPLHKPSFHHSIQAQPVPETSRPLLHSILQTETAAPFTKKPSSAYQIEYTSNIYNPEVINSMAHSSLSGTTFTSSRPTARPGFAKASTTDSESTTTAAHKMNIAPQDHEHYVRPDVHFPVYNLIIEGHSKVKTYGAKNGDDDKNNFPKIRPVQGKPNPIVEHHAAQEVKGPEFVTKQPTTDLKKTTQRSDDEKLSPMASLFSLFESSFDNFLTEERPDKVHHESENKIVEIGSEKRKVRRSISDNKQEKVFSVSLHVNSEETSERPQTHYRKGTVISEKLLPFDTDEIFK